MKDKKLLYIASAVCSALSIAAAQATTGHYDATKNRCYGSALAGQNDCPSGGHTCKGTAETNCNLKDWKWTKSQEECDDLILTNCPQNLKK